MPAKTPIYLKTPTDRKGRRLKLRDILSGDMISPPLGDVRHSAHVGPQGLEDMFGDVAFLQGSMDILPSMRAPHNGHEPLNQDPSISAALWSNISQEQAPPKPSSQTLSPDQDPSISAALWTISQEQAPPKPPNQDSSISASLWSTVSQEQAPPKPPRLHLETPPQHGPAHYPHLPPQNRPAPHLPSQNRPPRGPHEQDISLDHTIQRLVSSSGSSSEDSLFDSCGPLGATQGLSLDSDAGLSNEDLRSEDSPTLPHTDSILTSLNLDLGPSIMEDVLSIMDRYRESPDCGGPSESLDYRGLSESLDYRGPSESPGS